MSEDHPVHSYFDYISKDKKSVCKNCNFKMTGRHSNNLYKHIQRNHKDVLAAIEPEVLKFRSKPKSKANKKSRVPDDPFVTVKIRKSIFDDGCIDMVTKNCRPYSSLQDNGFRKIVDPILQQFQAIGHEISLDHDSMRCKTEMKLIEMKQRIAAEMKGKMLCLKIDTATKHDRCIFGVNVSYFHNNVFTSRCLAMKNMKYEVVGGLEMAKEIKSILNLYGTSVDTVYSVTTDNGSNVVLSVEILQIFQNHGLDDFIEMPPNELDQNVLEQVVRTELEKQRLDSEGVFLSGVRCSAHTMDLALDHSIDNETKEAIDSAQDVSKNLRHRKILNKLKEKGYKKPVLANETRWSSTFRMVSSINLNFF